MIKLSICVSEIDKKRIRKADNGKSYWNAILIETPRSDFGDYMVVEEVSKEEREAGKKGTILGNAKHIGKTKPKDTDEVPF